MDNRLFQDILNVLERTGTKTNYYTLQKKLVENFNYPQKYDGAIDELGSKIQHYCSVLQSNGLINIENHQGALYELTAKGYGALAPWYKKVWNFILFGHHNLFVVLALLISIVSIIISILKK